MEVFMNNVTNPSFKGVYKVNMPNVNSVKDEKEKNSLAETMVYALVMGANLSVSEPRVAKDNSAVYFKVDNKSDKAFEDGFKEIISECNKQFNTDMAKKVYYNKVDEAEYNKAEVLK